MDAHNLIAIFASRPDAERARDRLIQLGVPPVDIRLSPEVANVPPEAAPVHAEPRSRLWDWMFRSNIPERDRGWYGSNLREGRTALSVLVHSPALRDRAADLLERLNPLELEPPAPETEMSTVAPETRAPHLAPETPAPKVAPEVRAADLAPDVRDPKMAPEAPAPKVAPDVRADVEARAPKAPPDVRDPKLAPEAPPIVREAAAPARADDIREGEQVIPVVKEELEIGKRATQRSVRIRTYPVEKPVERTVNLEDERIIIERRPASGDTPVSDADLPQEREYEVVERHEEPVVDRRVRKTEDVVIRKEAEQRTEKVRDTVRETKIDIQKEPAGTGEKPLKGD